MSILISASVCLSDMIAKAKEGHSAFVKADNGKIYVNLTVWVNDEPDKYKNDVSLQLNSSKEKKEVEPKFYVGNGRKRDTSSKPVTASDIDNLEADDLPF